MPEREPQRNERECDVERACPYIRTRMKTSGRLAREKEGERERVNDHWSPAQRNKTLSVITVSETDAGVFE